MHNMKNPGGGGFGQKWRGGGGGGLVVKKTGLFGRKRHFFRGKSQIFAKNAQKTQFLDKNGGFLPKIANFRKFYLKKFRP